MLEPKHTKISSSKSQRIGPNSCLHDTFMEMMLYYHHLRCSPKIFLKSWIFWHLPYVFPIFIFGGGKKRSIYNSESVG